MWRLLRDGSEDGKFVAALVLFQTFTTTLKLFKDGLKTTETIRELLAMLHQQILLLALMG